MQIQAEGSKKGDYNLELQDRLGNWITVDLVSGGERSMACLALRIAFAKVLVPNFKLLILDEPTHNLDSRGVEELSNALRDRVSDLVDQVLVITHDERLEKAVTGACYRLNRNKRLDEPSKVTSM
jgi:DNA repair exonuclease SbcCD ATPase subunit